MDGHTHFCCPSAISSFYFNHEAFSVGTLRLGLMWRYPNGAGWVDSSQLSSPRLSSVAILNAAGFYYKPDRSARVIQ